MLLFASFVLLSAGTDVDRLAAGEILVRKLDGGVLQTAAVIDAPPERVWAVVSDCSNYKNTMPLIVESERLSLQGNVMTCRVVADVPFPMSDLVSVTRAELTSGPPKWVRQWTLVSGDYDINEGSWVLEAYGSDGKKTLATYNMKVKPKTMLPEDFIANAQKARLPEIMKRLRAQFARSG
jgi:ribosome-associated toxin RatA of RatAB toxin-antitoxin module